MKKQIADIKQFQTIFGFNVQPEPVIPSEDVEVLRNSLLVEEVEELWEASRNGDIVEVADAITDILYIVLGTACEYGVIDKLEECWDLVHQNNMGKVHPDGTIKRREDGKILKPEGFKKVELSTLFNIEK